MVNIGCGNGLLPGGVDPYPEPLSTNGQKQHNDSMTDKIFWKNKLSKKKWYLKKHKKTSTHPGNTALIDT